jgi:chemotaxis signal transduction protein
MTARNSAAWLLHLEKGLHAAIGLREMLYVMPDHPVIHPVPRAPAHAPGVVMWQQHLVPLIDLNVCLAHTAEVGAQKLVGIVACATASDGDVKTALGALLMSGPPERIEVSDTQACGLPDTPAGWRAIAASCFRHPLHGAVPILDLPAILSPAQAA